jgi:hypothetical protein
MFRQQSNTISSTDMIKQQSNTFSSTDLFIEQSITINSNYFALLSEPLFLLIQLLTLRVVYVFLQSLHTYLATANQIRQR